MTISKRNLLIHLFILFFLTGCPGTKTFDQAKVQSQEEIGSVHVTVFPPVPFEKYRSKISPDFSLSAEQALKEVAPTTTQKNHSQFTGVSAGIGLGINLPETGGDSVVPEESGKEEGNKRVLAPKDSPPVLESLDPLTRYWTAAALYQEVTLLNNYIKDLDFDDEYQAYVVRLQISQIPYVRRAAYDAIVDLNFFVESEGAGTAEPLPLILPMLVTDSLESAQSNYHAETVRDLALSLKAMAGDVGLNASGGFYKQLVDSILGRDLNSLLTVGRLHDNILRVRIGAMQQAAGTYAVVPHTQTVSVVVLVREEREKSKQENSKKSKLTVTSRTQWRNTLDPKKTPPVKYAQVEDYRSGFNRIYTQWGYNKEIGPEVFKKLAEAYNESDFEKFAAVLEGQLIGDETQDNDNSIESLLENIEALTECLAKTRKDLAACQGECKNRIQEGIERLLKGSSQTNGLAHVTPAQFRDLQRNIFPPGPYSGGTEPGDCTDGITARSTFAMQHDVQQIWGLFASMVAESPFDKTSVALPDINSVADEIPTETTPLYLFDNKKSMALVVPAVGEGNDFSLYGRCMFSYTDNSPDNDDKTPQFALYSTGTVADPGSKGIRLLFPSVASLDYQGVKPLSLDLYSKAGRVSENIMTFKVIKLVRPSEAIRLKSKLVITDNTRFIAADKDHRGSLRLYIEKHQDEEDLMLLVSGARLAPAGGADKKDTLAGQKNARSIAASGSVLINLENLIPGEKVTLRLSSKKMGLIDPVGELTVK